MRRLLTVARPSVLAVTIAVVLSLVGSALANRAIRDNTVNTRDIKDNQVNTRDIRNGTITTRDIRDNQVNTRDIRDGSIRGSDVHPGSLGASDLDSSTAALIGTTTLLDPRAHDQDSNGDGTVDNPSGTVAGHACCLSWSQGPTELSDVAGSATEPIPNASSGHTWRDVVLDPGAYVIETTAYAEGAATGAEAASGAAMTSCRFRQEASRSHTPRQRPSKSHRVTPTSVAWSSGRPRSGERRSSATTSWS
jgi:hypothetical protein